MSQAFTDALNKEFPADFASRDPADLATYGKDWTKVFAPAPSLLVRPRSTDEVSRFLKLASAHGIAVVPSGGRTGLAGGPSSRAPWGRDVSAIRTSDPKRPPRT